MPSSKKQRSRKAKLEKKKKQEERIEQKEHEVCRHGAPPADHALMPAYQEACRYFLTHFEQQDKGLFKVFENKYASLCADEDFLRFVVAECTNLVLQDPVGEKGPHTIATPCLVLALYIMYLHIPRSIGEDIGPTSENMATYDHYLKRITTTKGRILFVKKQTDCNCLDDLASKAKRTESTRRCVGCMQEVPRDEIWYCNGCNFTSYCSKTCQTSHW